MLPEYRKRLQKLLLEEERAALVGSRLARSAESSSRSTQLPATAAPMACYDEYEEQYRQNNKECGSGTVGQCCLQYTQPGGP